MERPLVQSLPALALTMDQDAAVTTVPLWSGVSVLILN